MNVLRLSEKVNPSILNQLIQNKDIDNETITLLKQYRRKMNKKTNRVEVNYKYSSNGVGRMYAEKSLSLQNFKKNIRHTLAHDLYWDIDMINAHPNILEQLCKKNGWVCDALNSYNSNRDAKLQEIMLTCEVSRKQAKELILRIMYLGEHSTWMSDNNCNEIPPKFVFELKKELTQIADNVWNTEKDIVKTINQSRKKEYYNKKASVLSIKLGTIENQILMSMMEWFQSNGFKVDVLVFDGLMVDKEKEITNNDLINCAKYAFEKTGYKIDLDRKAMNEVITILDPTDEVKEEWKPDEKYTNYYNQEYCSKIFATNGEIEYERKKTYIEMFLCKIQTPQVCYIFQNGEDKQPYIYNISDVNQLLEPIMSGCYTELGQPISFFEKWKKDPTQKCKRKYDFIPFNPTEQIDNDIYNLFTGFNDSINTEFDKSKRDFIIKPFIDILYEICGADDKSFDFQMKFFASLIQKPRDRPPVCCIWIGEQGTGKNMILDAIGNIINNEYYITSSKPTDFLGTHAEGFYRKLLVNINEAEGKNTFDFEGQFKSFITENTIIVNPKNVRPTKVQNHSHLIITSQKINAVPIDVKSRDRRYFAVRGTDKFVKHNRMWWSKIKERFNSKEFIACLYDKFMEIDISKVNWDLDRPITDVYREMVSRYSPIEALFIEDFIIQMKWVNYTVDEDGDITSNIEEGLPYYKQNGYKNDQKMKSSDFYNYYKEFCSKAGFYNRGTAIPDVKTFKSKIIGELCMPIEFIKSMGSMNVKINPLEVISYLTKKNWITKEEGSYIIEDEVKMEESEFSKYGF
jgi:hypothetical protein